MTEHMRNTMELQLEKSLTALAAAPNDRVCRGEAFGAMAQVLAGSMYGAKAGVAAALGMERAEAVDELCLQVFEDPRKLNALLRCPEGERCALLRTICRNALYDQGRKKRSCPVHTMDETVWDLLPADADQEFSVEASAALKPVLCYVLDSTGPVSLVAYFASSMLGLAQPSDLVEELAEQGFDATYQKLLRILCTYDLTKADLAGQLARYRSMKPSALDVLAQAPDKQAVMLSKRANKVRTRVLEQCAVSLAEAGYCPRGVRGKAKVRAR